MSRQTRRVESPSLEPQSRTRAQVYAFSGAPATPAELPELGIEETMVLRGAAPALAPPTETEAARAEEGVVAWLNAKKIEALWSDTTNGNSWIYVGGTGWKALSNANDSALLAMTMLSSHAEQTNATVNLRIEADGKVHEIYVW